jgi:SAM-dependent methyltransferase
MEATMNNFPHFNNDAFKNQGYIDNVPQNVSHLSSKAYESVKNATIGLEWYPANQHLRISSFQEQEYYEEYFMTTTYSNAMQQLQSMQIAKFNEIAGESVGLGAFVKIGCGDGSFLQHASSIFGNVTGIEPSKPFANAARSKNFMVLDGYVKEGSLLTENKFDFFASRQVFEHLPDPLDCLLGIKQMLNSGAVGLIEVPNGYRAFKDARFFEFFPDHVNYYSVNSLVSLANTAGFNVISCFETFGGDYLELWVRLDLNQDAWATQLLSMRNICLENICKWADVHPEKKLNVFFGCGAKALTVIARDPAFFDATFDFAIDSDPNKIGKFIPNTGIEIISLSDIRIQAAKYFWIMSLSYIDEIANLIRENIPGYSEISTLDNTLTVINL